MSQKTKNNNNKVRRYSIQYINHLSNIQTRNASLTFTVISINLPHWEEKRRGGNPHSLVGMHVNHPHPCREQKNRKSLSKIVHSKSFRAYAWLPPAGGLPDVPGLQLWGFSSSWLGIFEPRSTRISWRPPTEMFHLCRLFCLTPKDAPPDQTMTCLTTTC